MKRYTAVIELYVHAEDDEHAINKATKIAKELDEKKDNRAEVIELHHTPFGSLSKRTIFDKNEKTV